MATEALFEKYGRSYKPGEIVFSEGDSGEFMFIIQAGRVEISKNMDGHKHVLSVLSKGEFFGEMAIVTRVKRTATAKAVDDVQLLTFDRGDFQGMIEKNSKIGLSVIDKLCRRLQHSNDQIQQLLRNSFKSAIALNLYLRFQRTGGEAKALTLDRTQREIAKNIDVDEQIVSTAFNELAAAQVVQLQGNSLKLLDEARLCKVADEDL